MPEELCDVGGGISLCYETFGSREDPPALLIMGLATQMIAWHEDFCNELAERGFFVIRFDNRDIGRSTSMDFPPPSTRQLLTRRLSPQQYTLSDMAADTLGLMRELEIAPAHVIGASMGGMIGQTLAAEHPEAVSSLTSIMSTTGSRLRGQPHPSLYRYLARRPPSDREGYVRRAVELFGVIGSTGFPFDAVYVAQRAALSFERGNDISGGARQLGAILASGDRTKALRSIKAPTVVIHGSADKLVRPSGGRATAKAIPGAELITIKGMGHDLPRGAWPQILDAIAEGAARADTAGRTTAVAPS